MNKFDAHILVVDDDDGIIYTDFPSHKVYIKRKGLPKVCIIASSSCRFGDFVMDNARERVYAICEDHNVPDTVVNRLVSICIKDGSVHIIAEGNDFYSSPSLSPDASKLAFITWNHPHMLWDRSELRVQNLNSDGTKSGSCDILYGSIEKGVSVLQPLWSPKGMLYFISDHVAGWYNIYEWDFVSGVPRPVYTKTKEFSFWKY